MMVYDLHVMKEGGKSYNVKICVKDQLQHKNISKQNTMESLSRLI